MYLETDKEVQFFTSQTIKFHKKIIVNVMRTRPLAEHVLLISEQALQHADQVSQELSR